MHRLIGSPLGKAFLAIRDNDVRASLIGLNVYLLRLIAFVLAGFLAGVAGALFAFFGRYASASYMFYHVSGEAVVWAIVGGAGTLLGPHRRHQHLHHRARDRLDPLGAPCADRRHRRHPGGDLRAQGHRRACGATGCRALTERDAEAIGRNQAADRAMSEPVLRTENLTKRFGGLTAVDNLSFSLAGGRLHAIIGPNGAGKTTFFNLISGLLAPDGGRVFFHGRDITGLKPHADQPARHQAHAADQERVPAAFAWRTICGSPVMPGERLPHSVPLGRARPRHRARRSSARSSRSGSPRSPSARPARCPTATSRCSRSAWR